MNYFLSTRERNLWLWIFIIILGIFSTTWLSRPLINFLDDYQLTGGFYIAAFIMVIFTILWHGLNSRPGLAGIGVAIGVITIYALVLVRMTIPEERTHLIEYGILAIFIHEAFKERIDRGGKVRLPGFYAVLLASFLGLIDESIQYYIPNRVFDIRDVLFNTLASLMAVISSSTLTWISTKFR